METRFRSKKRVGNVWGGRGEEKIRNDTGEYGGVERGTMGNDGEPPQGARNDGVLASKAKAEKFDGYRPSTSPRPCQEKSAGIPKKVSMKKPRDSRSGFLTFTEVLLRSHAPKSCSHDYTLPLPSSTNRMISMAARRSKFSTSSGVVSSES